MAIRSRRARRILRKLRRLLREARSAVRRLGRPARASVWSLVAPSVLFHAEAGVFVCPGTHVRILAATTPDDGASECAKVLAATRKKVRVRWVHTGEVQTVSPENIDEVREDVAQFPSWTECVAREEAAMIACALDRLDGPDALSLVHPCLREVASCERAAFHQFGTTTIPTDLLLQARRTPRLAEPRREASAPPPVGRCALCQRERPLTYRCGDGAGARVGGECAHRFGALCRCYHALRTCATEADDPVERAHILQTSLDALRGAAATSPKPRSHPG